MKKLLALNAAKSIRILRAANELKTSHRCVFSQADHLSLIGSKPTKPIDWEGKGPFRLT